MTATQVFPLKIEGKIAHCPSCDSTSLRLLSAFTLNNTVRTNVQCDGCGKSSELLMRSTADGIKVYWEHDV